MQTLAKHLSRYTKMTPQHPQKDSDSPKSQRAIDYHEEIKRRFSGEHVEPESKKIVLSDAELMKAAGIGDRHLLKELETLRADERWDAEYTKVLEKVSKGGSVIICSKGRGSGKTQCAIEMIKLFNQMGKTAKYYKARYINNMILDSYGTNSRSKIIDSLVKPNLLIIDEFHERYNTTNMLSDLTLVWDMRYDYTYKATVLIANCDHDQVAKLVGSSINDRVEEQGGIAEFDLESFRAKGK